MSRAMTLMLLTFITVFTVMTTDEPAMAQAPESQTASPAATQDMGQRPSQAIVVSDTELGQTIAIELGKVLGVALSPAVGLAAVGLWYRATSEHPQSYWYASWWFIATMSSLALLVAAKDTLGSMAGPAKQIADGAEVLLNNGAGLIALAATLSWVVVPLGTPATELAQGMLDGLVPTAHAATESAALAAPTELAGWLGAGLLAAVTTILFGVVWLVSQTFNVMIMLNPFSPLDPFLKMGRLLLIGALFLACALSPWLGIPFAILIVLFSFFVSGYCLRMMVYGTVMAWDLTRGARGAPVSEDRALAFAGRGLSEVPTRTLGHLELTESQSLCFQYRPWLVLPKRTIELHSLTLYAVDGSLYPSLYEDPEGRSKATIDLPPRARQTCDSLARAFELGGSGESWLQRKTASTKSGISQLWSQFGDAWGVLNR